MRSTGRFLSLLLLSPLLAGAQQISPGRDIRWPANCSASNFQTYNFATNTCFNGAVQITAGTTTNLPPGSAATVTQTGTFPNYVLNFGIPIGTPGGSLSYPGVITDNANGLNIQGGTRTGSAIKLGAGPTGNVTTIGPHAVPAANWTLDTYSPASAISSLLGDSQNNTYLNVDPLPITSSSTDNVFVGAGAGVNFGNFATATFSTTATGTSGSNSLTLASAGTCGTVMSCVQSFMAISGAGIPAGTTITTIAGTTATLSKNLTAPLSATPVTVTPGYTQGAILIGSGAGNHMVANNGTVAIGYQAMYNMVTNGSDGEDINAVCIGPFACYSDTGASDPAIGNQYMFEPVVLGNKAYMYGHGERNAVIIGNHIYAPTKGQGATWIGGNTTNSWGGTGSFIQGTDSTFIGSSMFNGTPTGSTTYAMTSDTIIDANGANCYQSVQSSTIIGARIGGGVATCATLNSATGSIYIASGGTNVTGSYAPNWTGGAANIVLTAQQYGGSGALGGNLSTGNANVLIGGGAGAGALNSNRMTALGNAACKSSFFSGNDVASTCIGAETDSSSGTRFATALGYNAQANAASAVQIGSGTNTKANSLQFQGWNFLDSSGNGTFANLSATGGSPTFGSVYATAAVTASGVSATGALSAGMLSNYVGYSNLMSHTGWALAAGSVTVTENSLDVPPPFTGTQVNKLVFSGANNQWTYANASFPTIAGTVYTVCAWIRGASGGELVFLGNNQNGTALPALTTNWQYACVNQNSTGAQASRTYLIYTLASYTVYVAGVSTVLQGNASTYLPVNTGTPITTPTAVVNLPSLSAGPITVNSTGNLVNAASGFATLAAGTVTVSTTGACTAAAGCIYSLTNCGVAGTQGMLSVGTVTVGTSFVVNSSQGADTSKVCWRIN